MLIYGLLSPAFLWPFFPEVFVDLSTSGQKFDNQGSHLLPY